MKKGDARITLKDIEDGEEESEEELQPVNFGVRETPKPQTVSAEAQNGNLFKMAKIWPRPKRLGWSSVKIFF